MSTATPSVENAPRWDLESIFPGGGASQEYRTFVSDLNNDISELETAVAGLPQTLDDTGCAAWAAWILGLQDAAERIGLGHSFALCLTSQNVADTKANGLIAEAVGLNARLEKLQSTLESFAVRQDESAWNRLTGTDSLGGIGFYLAETRRIAATKMSEDKEKLALELAVDGFHTWNQQYERVAGDLRVTVTENGEEKSISLGQNSARVVDPDRAIRRDAFMKMEEAWSSSADLAAMILNALAGFRLTWYRNRGWDSYLHEPLELCRMQKGTLDAMWDAIADGSAALETYTNAKMKHLGIDKFCWYDQSAPVGKLSRTFTFEEAGAFITEHLGSFSEEIGEVVRKGLAERWVEAENRPGKRAGAWCSWLPIRRQARIFMTYSPDYRSLATLAHEFGHGYHGYVLRDQPGFARSYPMTLAETASIFNELRVADAAIAEAADKDEKLALLDQELQSALTFFCNIRARFLFDCSFYDARLKGNVETEQLSEMMTAAQREAYCGMLDESEGYHPLFWASKLHFFITDVPFYNFPYTFGFLFAKGVYARAKAEGPSFAKNYRALLLDTGRMPTEEVARRHLGVDLSERAFWDEAVAAALSGVDEFVALCG